MFNKISLVFISLFILEQILIADCKHLHKRKHKKSTRADFSDFENEVLNAHNGYREKHGVPSLKLNRTLCEFAQQWADNLASNDQFYHRPNNEYGENLYASTEASGIGKTAVDAWYNEIQSYDYAKPGFSLETGHFTQVVWKNSQELGVAMAKGSSMTYVVANYNPAGNYLGQFEENVPRPQ